MNRVLLSQAQKVVPRTNRPPKRLHRSPARTAPSFGPAPLPFTSCWPKSGIPRRFPLRHVNSSHVHPEDSPDGYLPADRAILPLALVIRALVQYVTALQRRSLVFCLFY